MAKRLQPEDQAYVELLFALIAGEDEEKKKTPRVDRVDALREQAKVARAQLEVLQLKLSHVREEKLDRMKRAPERWLGPGLLLEAALRENKRSEGAHQRVRQRGMESALSKVRGRLVGKVEAEGARISRWLQRRAERAERISWLLSPAALKKHKADLRAALRKNTSSKREK